MAKKVQTVVLLKGKTLLDRFTLLIFQLHHDSCCILRCEKSIAFIQVVFEGQLKNYDGSHHGWVVNTALSLNETTTTRTSDPKTACLSFSLSLPCVLVWVCLFTRCFVGNKTVANGKSFQSIRNDRPVHTKLRQ